MRSFHARRFAFTILGLLVALPIGFAADARAQAQGGTGALVGTAYDSTGALVPQATVKLDGKANGVHREQPTNDQGQYQFILLPVGTYTVTFSHPGFKTYKAQVEVTVGASVVVNATLAVGEVTSVIEVTANPVVESTAPVPDSLIGVRAIENLPINGRRFQDFVTLTPTVQVEPQRNGISFAGQRGINANIYIDGTDYNEPFFGGIRGGERSNNAYTIPQEAISQFQVVPYGYSVEFGRSTGGILNATTKSGTDNIHGSAFLLVRNGALARNDAFDHPAVPDQYQSGASLGGDFIKDKLFYFAAVEDQKSNTPHGVDFPIVDSFDPTTPTNALQCGAGGTRCLEAINFFKSLEVPYTGTDDALTAFGRLDYQVNARHRLATSYHYSKNTGVNATSTGDTVGTLTNRSLSNNGTEGDRTNTVIGQWTAIWRPTLIMETRGQYSLENRPRLANALQAGTITGIGSTGTRNFLPTTLDDYRAQIASNLTWTHGTHSVKFGGEYSRLNATQFFKFNQFGVFNFFSSTATTLQFMSNNRASGGNNRFDNRAVTYLINIGNGQASLTGHQIAFFGQDTWRFTPHFTLTAGLRWEGYVNPKADLSNTALYNQVKNFSFPIGISTDPAIIPNNYRQFMPRLGLAWDPQGNGKTAVRAGAGFFYAQTPLLLFAGPNNNYRLPAGDLSVTLPLRVPAANPCKTIYCQFLRIGIDLNTTPLTQLPTITPDQITQIATALGLSNPNPFLGAGPISAANNYKSPRSWQWDVGLEHEFAPGWSVGLDYYYANTVYLQRDRNLNIPPPLICAGSPLPAGCTSADLSLRPCFGVVGGGHCTQARPISTLGDVEIRTTDARARYNGLTLRTNYRHRRLQALAYYTYGRSYSNDDNERTAGGVNYDNEFNLKSEYGFSNLDIRHLFVFQGVVDLGRGFTFSTLGKLRSGRPDDAQVGSDVNGDSFSFNDRAFRAPGVSFIRNTFRDRRVYSVDMRVAKRFGLPREGMSLEITADIFNVFNFANVVYAASPFANATSANTRFGLGVDANGNMVAPPASFQRLFNNANCSGAATPTANPNCFDGNNAPNAGGFVPPFTVQFGIRFQF